MSEERTLGQLVSDASKDVSELIRYEVALAKAEIQADVKRGAAAGGLFGAAGYIVFLAVIILLIAIGLGLAEFMPGWLAFLVEAVVMIVIAGILALIGRWQMRKIKPPERSIRSAKETIAAVRGKSTPGSASGAAPTP